MSRVKPAERPRDERERPSEASPPRELSAAATPTAPGGGEPHKRPPVALVVAVVLTAILEILDITIVNVAVPHMLGAFGATPDQITWVLTSYLVSAAIVMPLTGYLSARLGRRRLLQLSITGFVIASALCGMAWDLTSMVIFRLAQGICGAPLVPLSQAILLDVFPRSRHGFALALFGLGIMVAPIMGPVLGGYLVDTFTWRAVFYINIPIGVLSLLLALGQLPKSPIRHIRTDWRGMALLVLMVGALQLSLDQGPTLDWFDSRAIQVGFAVTIFAAIAFFMRGWSKRDNIIDLSLFKDRNYLAGVLAITAFGISLFGSIALIPLFTQGLLDFPAMTAGMLFMPRAIASACTMIITGTILIRFVDPRYLVGIGICMATLGTLLMSRWTLQVDEWGIAWPGIVAGIGMGLFFVPLTSIAFAEIPQKKMDEAAGIYSLMRGIGASIGIAVVSWLFVDQGQTHWQLLIEHVSPFNDALESYFTTHGISPTDTNARALIAWEIGKQARMLAFIDLFWFIGWVTLGILPLLLLMKRPKKAGLVVAH